MACSVAASSGSAAEGLSLTTGHPRLLVLAHNLRLTGGVRMVQIATESGLMPKPIGRRRVLLGPGERAELHGGSP